METVRWKTLCIIFLGPFSLDTHVRKKDCGRATTPIHSVSKTSWSVSNEIWQEKGNILKMSDISMKYGPPVVSYWCGPKTLPAINLSLSQLWQWWMQMEPFIMIYFEKLYLCWWLTQEKPSQLERVDSAFRRLSLERKRCNPRCNISSQIVCKAHGLRFTERQLHRCTPVYHLCITASRSVGGITVSKANPTFGLVLQPRNWYLTVCVPHEWCTPLLFKLFSGSAFELCFNVLYSDSVRSFPLLCFTPLL